MDRSIAEQIPITYICPFCDFVALEESEVIDHLVEKHDNDEAKSQYDIT